MLRLSSGAQATYLGLLPYRKLCSFSQHPSAAKSSSSRVIQGWDFSRLSPFTLGFLLTWFYSGLTHAATATVSSYVQWDCMSRKHRFKVVSCSLWLFLSLHPTSKMSPGVCGMDGCCAECSTVWFSAVDQLCGFCIKHRILEEAAPLMRVRAALIYGYTEKYLESSLILCTFCNTIR